MSKSHAVLRLFRQVHLYLGVFTAPALLFFAFTGAMQTFSLHESTQGSSYKPPAWIASLAQLHKKQTLQQFKRPPRPESPPGERKQGREGQPAGQQPAPRTAQPAQPSQLPRGPEAPGPRPPSHLPMKIFFLTVAVGLFVSTLTGIYMAYRYSRAKLLITGLLAAGIILPVVLLPF